MTVYASVLIKIFVNILGAPIKNPMLVNINNFCGIENGGLQLNQD